MYSPQNYPSPLVLFPNPHQINLNPHLVNYLLEFCGNLIRILQLDKHTSYGIGIGNFLKIKTNLLMNH